MLAQLMNRTCTIITRTEGGTTDELGNDVAGEATVQTTCEIQQDTRTEEPDGSPARGRWAGFFPAGTRLRSGDVVSVAGEGDYEVVGDPWVAITPRTSVESHVEATLDLTRGSYEPS